MHPSQKHSMAAWMTDSCPLKLLYFINTRQNFTYCRDFIVSAAIRYLVIASSIANINLVKRGLSSEWASNSTGSSTFNPSNRVGYMSANPMRRPRAKGAKHSPCPTWLWVKGRPVAGHELTVCLDIDHAAWCIHPWRIDHPYCAH